MKKFLLSFSILVSILCVAFYSPQSAHTNQDGAPTGKTGSPGDGGSTCTSCHSSATPGATDDFVIMEVTAPLEYEAGETYSFDIMASRFSSTVFGFELIAEDDDGNSIGELIITDAANTQLIGGGNYITQTLAGSTPFGIGAALWSFDWQAPNDFEGAVTFYAAGNLSNGNGGTAGDVIMTDELSINVVDNSVVDVLGCTDPLATNFNPDATLDDGSCEYVECLTVTIDVIPGSFSYNNSWELVNELGDIVYSGAEDPSTDDLCLAYGAYTFNTFDSYGNGWSNGYYEISTLCNSTVIILANNNGEVPNNGTGDSGVLDQESTETFIVGECNTCLGFSIDIETTDEIGNGNADGTAEVIPTYGTAPFEAVWSNGETGLEITGLTAGIYSVIVTDAEGCVAEENFEINSLPYQMGIVESVESCNDLFTDSGGADGDFGQGESFTTVICPDEEGMHTQLTFDEFNLSWSGTLTIYDGENTSAAFLISGSYMDLFNEVVTATQDNLSGCLTVTFTSYSWATPSEGWVASINCHEYIYYGCMDVLAFNYDELAEVDDGSCYYAPGCQDSTFIEYHTQGYEADYDDGSCLSPYIEGCMTSTALNYNPYATYNLYGDPCVTDLESWECGMYYKDARDDYSYPTVLIGDHCWMAENLRFLPEGTDVVSVDAGGVASQFNDGFIYSGEGAYDLEANGRYYTWGAVEESVPFGWHVPTEDEALALIENVAVSELQNEEDPGFDAQASGAITSEDGTHEYMGFGDNTALWSAAELDDSFALALSVTYPAQTAIVEPVLKDFGLSVRAIFGFPEGTVLGCTDEDYIEYNPEANYDDGTCETVIVLGCTDESALNFNEIATVDDGTCVPSIEGCTDDAFAEYDETATVDNGSCATPAVFGCTDTEAQNYDELANVDDGSCIAHVLGCMDDSFVEYDENATLDDGTCTTTAIFGCMDVASFNYNSAANVDDGSCIDLLEGCTDPNYVEFNGQANVEDGSCMTPVVLGCTIEYALNYNPLANTDDGTCDVEGCTNEAFVEYDPNATIDNGTCAVIAIWGCTDDLYIEYFPPANMDDGSCVELIVEGCTDPMFMEYFPEANIDNGSCITPVVIGCTDPNFTEYNPNAVVDDNTCVTPVVLGCMDENYLEYNPDANTQENTSCLTPLVFGCTDDNYIEYSPLANVDDGSCIDIILEGCTDDAYIEFNPNANVDNGTCTVLVVLGCTDALAFNYDVLANTDDGSCIPTIVGCMDSTYVEFNEQANVEDNSMCINPVVYGCTDIEAFNYNVLANTDDGSCILQFVEITYVGFADGFVEFTPIVHGMGNEYTVIWELGDGVFSSDEVTIHQYQDNTTFEVTVYVNNGDVEVFTTITIEILNSTFAIDDVENSKTITAIEYYDLMGRKLVKSNLMPYQIHIQKTTYDDGSVAYLKRFKGE